MQIKADTRVKTLPVLEGGEMVFLPKLAILPVLGRGR